MTQDDREPCTLGNIEFAYRKDHPLFAVLSGHGVRLDGRYAEDHCGVLFPDTDTLVDGPGGVAVEAGDTIRHNPDWCAEGLYQASR